MSDIANQTRKEEGSGFMPLVDLATPEVYEGNAFRLLEVHVEATERDLAKRKQVMEVAARNNLPVPPGPCRILPRTPAPDEHEIRECSHAIQDAEHRLAQEFFWFWPLSAGQASNDPALRLFHQGDQDGAAKTWRDRENSLEEGPSSKHNQAVLYHFTALEIEKRLLNGETPPLASNGSVARRDMETGWTEEAERHWSESYKYWKAVTVEQRSWSRVVARIVAMDDKSLTTGAARRMEKSLPVAVTLITARLAIQAHQNQKPHHANRHVARIRGCGFEAEALDEALRIAVAPTRSAIKTLCDAAKKDAEADPAKADAATERLLEQTARPLGLLDLLLPQDNPARIAEHDQVALAALSCQIDFGNKTENWKRCLELLKRMTPLAASTAARERIAQNQKIVLSNFESSRCWFCQKNDGQEKYAVKMNMHGNVKRFGGKVSWSHREIRIPKCKSCRNDGFFFVAVSIILAVALLAGSIYSFVFCLKPISALAPDARWLPWVVGVVWVIIPILLLRMLHKDYSKNFTEGFNAASNAGEASCLVTPVWLIIGPSIFMAAMASEKIICLSRGLKKKNKNADYPVILQLKGEGWALGKKPPRVQ